MTNKTIVQWLHYPVSKTYQGRWHQGSHAQHTPPPYTHTHKHTHTHTHTHTQTDRQTHTHTHTHTFVKKKKKKRNEGKKKGFRIRNYEKALTKIKMLLPAILERLEFKNCSSQPTMMAGNTFPFLPPLSNPFHRSCLFTLKLIHIWVINFPNI